MTSSIPNGRLDDLRRHLADLARDGYEGASDLPDRERVFRTAFGLVTPLAHEVLSTIGKLCSGSASVATSSPQRRADGGLAGAWTLTWPALERARNRFTGQALPPVRISALYPSGFTHAHLCILALDGTDEILVSWPFQVRARSDVDRQAPILWAIAEGELHERIFAADVNWRLLEAAALAVEN